MRSVRAASWLCVSTVITILFNVTVLGQPCVLPDESCAYSGTNACLVTDVKNQPYMGSRAVTVYNEPCIDWSFVNDSAISTEFIDQNSHNLCRNPYAMSSHGPWCFSSAATQSKAAKLDPCFAACGAVPAASNISNNTNTQSALGTTRAGTWTSSNSGQYVTTSTQIYYNTQPTTGVSTTEASRVVDPTEVLESRTLIITIAATGSVALCCVLFFIIMCVRHDRRRGDRNQATRAKDGIEGIPADDALHSDDTLFDVPSLATNPRKKEPVADRKVYTPPTSIKYVYDPVMEAVKSRREQKMATSTKSPRLFM